MIEFPNVPRPEDTTTNWTWSRFSESWVRHEMSGWPMVGFFRDEFDIDHPIAWGTVRCDYEVVEGKRCLNMYKCSGKHSIG